VNSSGAEGAACPSVSTTQPARGQMLSSCEAVKPSHSVKDSHKENDAQLVSKKLKSMCHHHSVSSQHVRSYCHCETS
jgi:hypothetical protein